MKFDKKDIGAAVTAGLVALGLSIPSALTGCQVGEKDNNVTWDDIKKSYVALVEEDGVYVKSLLKIKGNGIYENLLYDNVYFGDEVLEYHEAVPYFVQTDNVKNSYTKSELEEIIKDFKIDSNEYDYSDDYVIMK